MYINREIEKTIEKTCKVFPCIVLYGPRQVGKSTTINHLFGKKYQVVSLDDIDERTLATNNPKLFLDNYEYPLVIDEIQKVPTLLDEIKKRIDKQRLIWMENKEEQKLMYILTGSNRFELQEGISDSLAGRCGIVEMNSLTFSEKYKYDNSVFNPEISQLYKREKENRKYKNKKKIFEDIFFGGMPDVFKNTSSKNIFFKSYVNTYIEQDVKKLIDASKELQFRNFISIVALNTAQELHYDRIANEIGIDVRTCKRWISILETSGIITLLYPYMSNISKRIIKAPKLYFMDTGLCTYLCKWPNAEMLESCAMSGAIFETYVVSEIIKNLNNNNIEAKNYLYYYRDIDKKEIDLLYVDYENIYPIEIKKGINPTKPNKNFNVLSKYKLNIKPGIIIDNCEHIRPINENAYIFPVFLL